LQFAEPEGVLITFVRDDVVSNRGRDDLTTLQAFHT
jgi:hypothetical protein